MDWITSEVTSLLESYLFGEAGRQLREFVWSELCDWYIEAAKVRLRGSDEERAAVAQTLAYVLERSVRLLHPFMPFATEALWQQLPHVGESVMVASWPDAGERDLEAEETLTVFQELVSKIRNARAEMNVEPAKWIAATIYTGSRTQAFESLRGELGFLGRIADSELTISAEEAHPSDSDVVVVASDVVAVLPLTGLVDLTVERARLEKELDQTSQERRRLQGQLGNAAFVERAPANVVEGQRQRLAVVTEQIAVLERRLQQIGR
jgi:valyl-tRNA synthetase